MVLATVLAGMLLRWRHREYRLEAGLFNAATLLADLGHYSEAEAALRDVLAIIRESWGERNQSVLSLQLNLVTVLWNSGKHAEAERLLSVTLKTAEDACGRGHPVVAECLYQQGYMLKEAGDLTAAKAKVREAIRILRRSKAHFLSPGSRRARIADYLAVLGIVLLGQHEYEDAENYLRECLEIRTEQLPEHWTRFHAMNLLGVALARLGKLEEAEPLLLEGYAKMNPPASNTARKLEALERIVVFYEAWGKLEQAAEWRAKLAATTGPASESP
jgi:tetratricopeptide (TPR) repeat protein